MHADWKERLDSWAPAPPPGVWERLSESLPTEEQPLFAQRLFQFETEPPKAIWDKVTGQLSDTKPAPVIRLFPRNRMVRYASVAASILVAIFLLRQVSFKDPAAALPSGQLQQTLVPLPQITTGTNQQASGATEIQTTETAPKPQPVYYSFSKPANRIDDGPLVTIAAQREALDRIVELIVAPVPEVNDGSVERYMVLAITENEAVRIPKKLYDLFRCNEPNFVSGCSELVNRIRQHNGAPSLLASTDFAGVLEVITQIDNP